MRESGQRKLPYKASWVLMLLTAGLVVLGTIIALWQGGAMGFMQGLLEKGNVLSISILAIFVGVVFVLLQKLGLSFNNAEEIGQENS